MLGELAGHVAEGEVEVFGVVGEVHGTAKQANVNHNGLGDACDPSPAK